MIEKAQPYRYVVDFLDSCHWSARASMNPGYWFFVRATSLMPLWSQSSVILWLNSACIVKLKLWELELTSIVTNEFRRRTRTLGFLRPDASGMTQNLCSPRWRGSAMVICGRSWSSLRKVSKVCFLVVVFRADRLSRAKTLSRMHLSWTWAVAQEGNLERLISIFFIFHVDTGYVQRW